MLSWNEILIRLLCAALFGALIGLERERKDWAAGMRTHMMVCVGAALVMMVSAFAFSDVLGQEHVVLDPSRIAAQVISGIGFIGAGTILFLKQGTIRGLTTASGLWTVAAIGLATGGGMYFAAAVTTLIALIILWALQPLERRYARRFRHGTLRIVIYTGTAHTALLQHLLDIDILKAGSFTLDRDEDKTILLFRLQRPDVEAIAGLIQELHQDKAVKEVTWYP